MKTFQFKWQNPSFENLCLIPLKLNYSIWLRTKNQENLRERAGLKDSLSVLLCALVSQRDNGSNWTDLQALCVFLADKVCCVIPWCSATCSILLELNAVHTMRGTWPGNGSLSGLQVPALAMKWLCKSSLLWLTPQHLSKLLEGALNPSTLSWICKDLPFKVQLPAILCLGFNIYKTKWEFAFLLILASN